ncbi:MAG TPA: hypothetical protein VGS79_22470 [Puia sp.]|nr:hypothetical protein [Puia sp.]
MDDKELEMLIALATAKLERGFTQEEARRSLYEAGIVDLDGNFTEPYKHLEFWDPTE